LVCSNNVLSIGNFLIKGDSNGKDFTIGSDSGIFGFCNATGFFTRSE
jgi:hypothetical protein